MPDKTMAVLMENMVLFGKTLVQKLYGGMFLGEPQNLLNFLADQIVVVRHTNTHTHTHTYHTYKCFSMKVAVMRI